MLLYGADKNVCEWVSLQLFKEPDGFSDLAVGIGVILQGRIIAGVIYDRYIPDLTIEMSVASVDKRWATRHNLKAFFMYPFIELGLKRVQTLCSAKEEDTMRFNQRLGFKQEGYHRQAWPMGGDAVSFGMLKDECVWIKEFSHG